MTDNTGTFSELSKFYYQRVKPLYCYVQTTNRLPAEVLFEIHAAFDHLTRHYVEGFNDNELESVRKSYSHLKRSCLDIYKLKLKETVSCYEELKGLDTSIVDNGMFDTKMHNLMGKIRENATQARLMEGCRDTDKAFDLWEPVFADCVEFEKEYFLSQKVQWARKKQKTYSRAALMRNLAIGIVSSSLVTLLAANYSKVAPVIETWIKGLFN